MFFTYIIKSESNGKWYYGNTERPEERIKEHNGNHHHFTAGKGPWSLIFLREFTNRKEALTFERKLKSNRNKEFIRPEFREFFLAP